MRKVRAEKLRDAVPFFETHGKPCDFPGCTADGEFRAPKSRSRLGDFHWFCLEHVRAYNRSWDYYKGMTPEEIEWHVQQDVQWRRPVWPLGGRVGMNGPVVPPEMRDLFGLFDESGEEGESRRRKGAQAPKHAAPLSAEDKALRVLDLDPPATMAHIKAKYIELVKQLHPDANGGDMAAEEKLKLVNQAYATLRTALAR